MEKRTSELPRAYIGTVYLNGMNKPMPVDQYQWDWLRKNTDQHIALTIGKENEH